MINRPYDIIEKLLTDTTKVFAELMGYDTTLLAHLMGKEGEILVRGQQISIGKYQIQKALVIFDYEEKQSQLFCLQRRATIDQLTALLKLV